MYFPRHNGVDHSADTPSMGASDAHSSGDMAAMAMPGMKMYMHGTIGGDLLWFASWQPSGAGATVGVCVGLFLLAILDRYIHALWRACGAAWGRGKVGFALPVARGDLPPSAGASSALAEGAVRRREAAPAPVPAPVSAPAPAAAAAGSCCSPAPAAPAAPVASYCEKRLSPSPSPPPGPELAPGACACGCGGECGTSAAAPCRGTGECVPDYSTPITPPGEKAIESPSNGSAAALAYLPSAVRANLDPARPGRWSRPFRLGTDVPRGLLYMLLSTIHFALMLVVMTFQIWWIVAVVVGLGVGEMLFGRFGGERV